MSLRTFRQDPGDGLFTLPFGLLDGGSSALGGGGAASEGGGGSSSIPVGDSSSGAHESSSGTSALVTVSFTTVFFEFIIF